MDTQGIKLDLNGADQAELLEAVAQMLRDNPKVTVAALSLTFNHEAKPQVGKSLEVAIEEARDLFGGSDVPSVRTIAGAVGISTGSAHKVQQALRNEHTR